MSQSRDKNTKITTIIPALNEEESIGKVIGELPSLITEIIVCDNGSIDRTAKIAQEAGARVVREDEKGYGAACLRAISEVSPDTDILLFVDADYSDYPTEATMLLEPIMSGEADMVIGSRMATLGQHHALPPVAAFGNWLTSHLIRLLWGVKFTDIGPFRAIRFSSYQKLKMRDPDFGWTTEMQVKAVKIGLKTLEVPVSYRKRIGQSKISGTVMGSIRAGVKFLWIIFREWVR